jgi:branched-subunit amino acid transport protein
MNALCVFAAAGLLTWVLRVGLIKIIPARTFPKGMRAALEATGPAAMASLIVNSLLHASSEGVATMTAALLATIVAAVLVWRFHNVALVAVAGMATYWALSLAL